MISKNFTSAKNLLVINGQSEPKYNDQQTSGTHHVPTGHPDTSGTRIMTSGTPDTPVWHPPQKYTQWHLMSISTRRINSCWGWCSNTRCHNNLTQSLINDHSQHNKTPEPYPSEDDWVIQDRTTGSVESGVKTKRGWDETSPPEQDSSIHMWNSISS